MVTPFHQLECQQILSEPLSSLNGVTFSWTNSLSVPVDDGVAVVNDSHKSVGFVASRYSCPFEIHYVFYNLISLHYSNEWPEVATIKLFFTCLQRVTIGVTALVTDVKYRNAIGQRAATEAFANVPGSNYFHQFIGYGYLTNPFNSQFG